MVLKISASTRPRKGVQERRERVLEAAKVVFASKGFSAATVDEVAALAMVGKGTIYRLCGNKKELLHAVLHQAADSLVTQITQGFRQEDDSVTKLQKIVGTLCGWYEEHLELGKVLFSTFHSPKKKPSAKKEKERDHLIFGVVKDVFKEGVREGVFTKTIDPQIAPEFLFHLFTPFVYEELRNRYRLSPKQIARLIFNFLYKGFGG